jgi:phosphohistidine phosphatase
MKLYILRHAEAVDHDDPKFKDADRPLTPKGIERTRLLAHVLRQMEIGFDVILTSPLLRAKDTAEILERGLRLHDAVQASEHLKPGGSVDRLIDQINSLKPAPDAVVLVGHEPFLSGLISTLCTGGSGLVVTLKKGALCRMEVETLRAAQCASLEWLLQPRVIGFKPPKRKKGS